jgi:hypothetical protein
VAIARIKVGLYTSMVREGGPQNRSKRTFDAKRAYLIKMIAVYVRIHAEQSSHNGAHSVLECPRE